MLAARTHLHALSYESAAGHVRSADRVVRRWEIREDGLNAELRLLEGESLRWEDGTKSAQAFVEAVSLAREVGDTSLFVSAALGLCRRGQSTLAGIVDDVAKSAVDECLEQDDLTYEQRARLLATSSVLFAVSTSDDELRRRFQEALVLAREEGDAPLEAEILLDADLGLGHPEDFAQRQVVAKRLGELAGDDPDLRWEAAWLDFGNAVVLGDVETVRRACLDMREGVGHCVQRPRNFGMAIVESVVNYLSGQFDAAQGWADVVLDVGLRRFPESWALNAYGALLLGNRDAQGRVGELYEAAQNLLAGSPEFPSWQASAAFAGLHAGEREVANQLFDGLALESFSNLVEDGSWTAIVGALLETAAGLDRPADTKTLYELLKPFSGRMLWTGLSTMGPVDARLAIAAQALGEDEDAAAHLAKAAELTNRLRQLAAISQVPPTLN